MHNDTKDMSAPKTENKIENARTIWPPNDRKDNIDLNNKVI